MNRRQWLQRVSVGVVGACIATKLPTAWLPAPVKTYAACEFLRQHWLSWREAHGESPQVMVVDAELFAAYRHELVTNFRMVRRVKDCAPDGPPMLMFKDSKVVQSQIPSDTGWRVVMVSGEREEAA